MKVYFILFTILTITSFSSQAKMLELKKSTRSIFIEEKKGWMLKTDLFGMPFIYFSPQANGQRSNISFTDTGADLALDVNSLATTQDKYKKLKNSWAQKVGANSLSFSPYELTINNNGHRVHRMGFTYEHEGKAYNEKSFYIECRGKIYFSKSLRLLTNEKHEKDFNDLISNLDCGGV